jgi:hypothetical protein
MLECFMILFFLSTMFTFRLVAMLFNVFFIFICGIIVYLGLGCHNVVIVFF